MRHKPSITEINEISEAAEEERLLYFLTRAIESEEVWGIGDHKNWLLKEIDNQQVLPVWPYEILVKECINPDDEDKTQDAISLEQFVYHVLQTMIKQDIGVEVLPTKTQSGKIIAAQDLVDLLEGMMDSGEYYLEG